MEVSGERHTTAAEEKIITAAEYLKMGFGRIDWVHMATEEGPLHNPRERLIIKRMQDLKEGGIDVHVIGNELDEDLDGVEGHKIIVGGGIGDVCWYL